MSHLLSVGIDIGTSTTQLVFSRITMENTTSFFTVPKISIVETEVLYKSAVHFTPLKTPVLIDAEAVRRIVAEEYRKAGYTPADVDTGAVIITGESARKENAAAVTEELSRFAGDFVVSTAGPDLESVIAGKGSGAFQYSMDHHCLTANLDIGGGTTNIVLFDDGAVVGRTCYDIGGRLIRLDPDWTVTYIAPAVSKVAQSLGIPLKLSQRTDEMTLRRVTNAMADLLTEALFLAPQRPLLAQVQTAGSSHLSPPRKAIRRVFLSGGVAEAMTDPRSIPYGDIGVLLGRSIGATPLASLREMGKETIRATVVGAGTYTTSLSGSTIDYDPHLFPMKNLPVCPVEDLRGSDEGYIADLVRTFLQQNDCETAVLSLTGRQDPDYEELKTLAAALARGADRSLPRGAPLIVALQSDFAKALGLLLRRQLQGSRPLICIDSVQLSQGDYVDLGRPALNGLVIPLIIKTLLFG